MYVPAAVATLACIRGLVEEGIVVAALDLADTDDIVAVPAASEVFPAPVPCSAHLCPIDFGPGEVAETEVRGLYVDTVGNNPVAVQILGAGLDMLHYLEGNFRTADNFVGILDRHIPGEEDPAVLGQKVVVPQTVRAHTPDCHPVGSLHCARR